MKQKIFSGIVGLVLIFAVFELVLTHKSRPEPIAQDDERQRIVYYASINNITLTEAIVNSFNRQSLSTVVNVVYDRDEDYDEMTAARLASGSGNMDCLYLRQPSQSSYYAANGLLTDLNPFVSTSDLDLANYGATLDAAKTGEAVYALPQIRNVYFLFYNRTLFREKGLDYPKNLTWRQYAGLARQLSSGEGLNRVWGGYIPVTLPFNIGACAAQEYLTNDSLEATKRYLVTLRDLLGDGSHPSFNQSQYLYRDYYDLFENGKIAMMINGDWAIAEILRDLESDLLNLDGTLDWDVAALPVPEGTEAGTTVGSCSYLAIPAGSTHSSNAFEFISYFCGEKGAAIMARYAACPAYFTAEAAGEYLSQTGISGAELFFDSHILNEEVPHPKYGELESLFRQCAIRYLIGISEIDEAMESYLQSREKLLS